MPNLSQQLCEICGLKYCKEKVVINNGQCPNVDIKPFYLNFEKLENFVRLFSLITTRKDFTYSTGLYYMSYIRTYRQLSTLVTSEDEYISESEDVIEAFLTCVIKCAKKEKDVADYIRKTEWLYV